MGQAAGALQSGLSKKKRLQRVQESGGGREAEGKNREEGEEREEGERAFAENN